jgi:hypothetical protein
VRFSKTSNKNMKNHTKFALLALILPLSLWGQPWPDSRWVGGFEENPGVPGYANYSIRFNSGGGQVDTLDWGMRFESTSASYTDSTGKLLFVSNGCSVMDGQGKVLLNGEGLNPGEMYDWTCDKVGYVAPRGAMALPAPGKAGVYYLFHMGLQYDPVRKLRYGPLYCSVVDMNANSGKGAVTLKNKVLIEGELEPFCAVRHGNGRDWWLVAPAWHTNELHTVLLSPQGPLALPSQSVGTSLAGHRVGATAFSLDGRRFARYHCDQGAVVADFDRCTGEFSQPVFVKTPFSFLQGGGAAFSPDSRRLYVTSQSTLYVADLEDAAPKWDTVFHVFDNWDWGTTLHHMQYAPDGKLYVSTHSRANYLSALAFPPDGGLPTFAFRALPLRVHSDRSLPNFPNFRLFDWPNSPCDTLGIDAPTSSTRIIAEGSATVRVWPNPANGNVSIDLGASERRPLKWTLYSPMGQVLRSEGWPRDKSSVQFSVGNLPPGAYYVGLQMEDGSAVMQKLMVF